MYFDVRESKKRLLWKQEYGAGLRSNILCRVNLGWQTNEDGDKHRSIKVERIDEWKSHYRGWTSRVFDVHELYYGETKLSHKLVCRGCRVGDEKKRCEKL